MLPIAVSTFEVGGFPHIHQIAGFHNLLAVALKERHPKEVLKTALETEQKAQTRESRDEAALSHANYEFAAMSVEADRQLRLQIRPRRRHVMLIDGSLAIDAGSLDLLTVEGELSKRPSFWTRRVHITREYQRLAGVHVPVAMRSRADVLMVGASTFAMTWEYESINGRPVSASAAGTPVESVETIPASAPAEPASLPGR